MIFGAARATHSRDRHARWVSPRRLGTAPDALGVARGRLVDNLVDQSSPPGLATRMLSLRLDAKNSAATIAVARVSRLAVPREPTSGRPCRRRHHRRRPCPGRRPRCAAAERGRQSLTAKQTCRMTMIVSMERRNPVRLRGNRQLLGHRRARL